MTRNQLQYHTMLETMRSNRVNEAETHRSNRTRETETHRSNVVNETETNRSNVARETETNRTNVANEHLKQLAHNENVRHNKVEEGVHIANAVTQGIGSLGKGVGSVLGAIL